MGMRWGKDNKTMAQKSQPTFTSANFVLHDEGDAKPVAWLERLEKKEDGCDIHFIPELEDVIAQCPACHTLETLQFVGAMLTPCRKFYQKEGLVYHDCGSSRPCHLYSYTYCQGSSPTVN